ncbi:sensor histidine kinase [Tranquillimonas rosea]|nr:ATP-binding protein [Tranquillimonas rosea]
MYFLRIAVTVGVFIITAITAVSLVNLTGLVSDIRTSERSKPAWIVSRVEFDLLRFQRALAAYRMGELSEEELSLRFDILWSRLDVATSATTGELLSEFDIDLSPIQRTLDTLKQQEDDILSIGEASPAELDETIATFNALEEPLRDLTLETLEATSQQSQRYRERLLNVAQKSALLTGLLVVVLMLCVVLVGLEARRHRRVSMETFRLLKASRAAAEAKAQFISVVNHELRTPLTSIKGSLGLLRGGAAGELQPDAQRLIEMAYTNSESLSALINDLLEIDRAEAGQLALKRERLDVSELVRDAIEANANYAAKQDITIREGGLERNLLANVDRQRLGQVLANLLSNAVKFSEPHGEVTVTATRSDDAIRIAVRDTGIGIPDDKMQAIFERFHQVDSSAHRKRGGTGLGLSITKAIVEQHGGTLEVTSTLGVGSTFTIVLPFAPTVGVGQSGLAAAA